MKDNSAIYLKLARAILGSVEPDPSACDFLVQFQRMLDDLDPKDRRDLAWGIRVLNASPFFYGRWANFLTLKTEAAEAHLRRLSRSRIAGFRRLVSVLKTMVVYSYYGQEKAWPQLEYDGPWLGRIDVERLADPQLGALADPPHQGEGS